jgi:hypothetical protein
MYDLIRELNDKLSNAEHAAEELSSAKEEIEEAEGELSDFIDAVQDLISNLENLPNVSFSVNIDTGFDSDN